MENASANPIARPPERQPSGCDKVVLVGMMGAGKSTLGRMLAAKLECPFVDVDVIIECEVGCSIATLFRERGEEEFRRIELDAIRRLVAAPGRMVLATGGGAFCQQAVRQCLGASACSVFLQVDEEELLRRLARADVCKRPMLAGEEWQERVAALVRLRYPLYAEATLALEIGDEKPSETVARLYELICKYWRS